MAYIICEPCIDVKDKACVDICPVDCIYDGDKEGYPNMLFINPDECIDCSVCEPECPVQAIFAEDDVPEEWNKFIPINYTYFGQEAPQYQILSSITALQLTVNQ